MLDFLPGIPLFGTPDPICSVGDSQDPHWAQGNFNHPMRLSPCAPLGGKAPGNGKYLI